MRIAVSLLLGLAACRPSGPPIASCADDLSGVWEVADGRRFHLVERPGGRLEVYPLFDATAPDKQARPHRTPAKTELERVGDALVGKSTSQAQAERLCTIVTPARLEGCAGGRARLLLDLAPPIDMAACAASPRPLPPLEIRRL